MEAAVANFAEPGQKFALLTNGFFADRIGEMARRQGAQVVRLEKGWGEPHDAQEVREFIRRERPRLVAFVQAETSTGMFNHAKPICEAAHEVDALVIGDCVTSLGGMPVLVDENGIDIAYSCTQKGLGCTPGLAPMTVGPRALERLKARTSQVQSWYLDLLLLDTYYSGHKYHHTASATCSTRCARPSRWWPRKGWRTAGNATAATTWRSSRASKPWASRCTFGIPRIAYGRSTRRGFRRAWTTPKCENSCSRNRGIEISGGFGPLAGRSSASA